MAVTIHKCPEITNDWPPQAEVHQLQTQISRTSAIMFFKSKVARVLRHCNLTFSAYSKSRAFVL